MLGECTLQILSNEHILLGQPVSDSQPTEFNQWVGELEATVFNRCVVCTICFTPAYLSHSFIDAARIGTKLKEAWLVTNALVYAWNHTSHCASNGQYVNVLDPLATLATVAEPLVKV